MSGWSERYRGAAAEPQRRCAVSDPQAPTPDPDRRTRRREERAGRREERSTTTAVVLIVAGAALLLGRGFGFRLENWWALFLLIPAAASLGTAYRAYRASDGRLDRSVSAPALSGAILLLVAAVFLFGLDWSLMGAVIIILVGAAMLLRRGAPG